MYLYKIINNISDSIYIGITRSSLGTRWSAHKWCCKRGIKTPLYDSMRSKGIDEFRIEIISTFQTTEELEKAEKDTIKQLREQGTKVYNILDGGASYFPIRNKEEWKIKLREKRVGKKPALGMNHTAENKELFVKVAREYWDTQNTYPTEEIIKHSFKEAKLKFGISKTHYYRLKKTGLSCPIK